MKNLLLTFAVVALLFSPVGHAASAKSGCDYNGKTLSFGSEIAIDKNNPETIRWHSAHFQQYGINPDGGAYKMAVCTVIVNPSSEDYPRKGDRVYVWVMIPNSGQSEPFKSYSDSSSKVSF